jgi:hypothetical protein
VDGIDGRAFCQCGLGGGVGGNVKMLDPCPGRGHGHREHPGDGPQLAAEGQLAHQGGVLLGGGQLASGHQNADQDGQVVDCPRLAAVGGGQIDGNAGDGKGKATVFDDGANPVPGLLHGGVGQADDVKVGQPTGQIALGRDLVTADPLKPQGTYFGHHLTFLPSLLNTIFPIIREEAGKSKGREGFVWSTPQNRAILSLKEAGA